MSSFYSYRENFIMKRYNNKRETFHLIKITVDRLTPLWFSILELSPSEGNFEKYLLTNVSISQFLCELSIVNTRII